MRSRSAARSRSVSLAIVTGAAGLLLLLTGGCVRVVPAGDPGDARTLAAAGYPRDFSFTMDHERMTTVRVNERGGPSIDWPARDRAVVQSLVHDAPIDVINRHAFVDRPKRRFTLGERTERGRLARTRPAGVGVIRHWVPEPDRTDGGADRGDADHEHHMIFVSSWTYMGPAAKAGGAGGGAGDGSGGSPAGGPGDAWPEDRHWGVRMRYRPVPPGLEVRGIVVHLHGLDGHGLERRVTEPLRQAGWGVLECPYPLVNWRRLDVDVTDPQDVAEAGKRMASIIDERFGELAYAAEAAVLDLAADGEPAAVAGPILLSAFSAGGNAASAVAARLSGQFPGRLQAAAIVMGGADLIRISADSSLADTGMDMRRGDDLVARSSLNPAERASLTEAYLPHTQLDGWAIAPSVDVPVLLVLGRFDAIVPRGAGAALRERLGQPETWWISAGHYGGYLSMPWMGRRIARWMLGQATDD